SSRTLISALSQSASSLFRPRCSACLQVVQRGFFVCRTTGDYTGSEEALMKYKIAIHRTEEGISVSVPALPGCWSEGDTEEEALANIQDAIREHLAALQDRFQGAEVREVEVQG